MAKDKASSLAIDFSKFTDEDLEAYERGETSALSDNALEALADYEDKFNEMASKVGQSRELEATPYGLTTAAAGTAGALATGIAPRSSQQLVDKALPEDLRGGYKAPAAAPTVAKPTVAPAPGADYFSPFGAGEGAVKNATHNVDEVLKNKVAQAAIKTPGYVAPGNSLILQPSSSLPTPAAPTTGSPVLPGAAKPKVGMPQMRAALQSPEVAPANRLSSSIKGGAAAGFGANAIEEARRGNYGDAATSGVGSVSSLAAMASNPKLARAGKLGMAATILGKGYQSMQNRGEPQQKAAGGVVGYAKGKAVKGGLEAVKKLLEPEAKGYLHHTEINPNPLVGTRYETRDLGGLLPVKEMRVEDLKGAMVNTNPWDLTSRNVAISSVSGKPLTKEYVTHGGHGYARDIEHQKNKIAGASSKEIATRVQNRANESYKEAEKLGGSGKVYTAPGSMGAFSENFALPTTEIYYDLFQQANLPKSVIKQQSDYLRSIPGDKKTFPFSKMPDLDDPDTMNLFEQNPEFRKAFLKLQQFKNNQKLLGVNAEDVSNAMTDKDLLGLPRGYAGHTMIEMIPGAEILPAKSTKTYPFDTQGIYGGSIGHTPIPVLLNRPYEKAFQEIRAKYPDKPEAAIRSMAIGALETRGKGVSEFMDEEAINRIGQYHEGVKQGKVDPRSIESGLKYIKQPGIYAEGGEVQGYSKGKAVQKLASNLILPPAENAARTQIIGTLPTYQKAADILQQRGATGRAIDFGAGLGEGAKALGNDVDTFEPYAKNWFPTYSNAKDIPSDAYGRLTNLNVLNVAPREARDEIVLDIGRVMEPGGMGIITTRGKDVMNAKGVPGPEPMSIITSRDTYQKGFNKDELEEYLKYMLGDKFDINRLNLGPAGALIKKKAEGGLAQYKEGGSTSPAWQRKEGKNPEGGLNAAGRASYNRETGGNLKAPQPEGGPRKKSFCARMSGMKKKLTSSETANDPDSRINKALRKWKC